MSSTGDVDGPDGARPAFNRSLCLRCLGLPRRRLSEHALLVVGREMSADECLALVARDLPFYRNSRGGLTLSGGEPLAWPAFVRAVLEGCRARVHTVVETAGDVAPEAMQVAIDRADAIFFDLKLADPAAHQRLTGRPLAPVLANLAAVSARRADSLVLRVPVIPTVNDAPETVAALAAIARVTARRRWS